MNFIGDFFAIGLVIILSFFFFDKKYYLTTASKFFMAALSLTAASQCVRLRPRLGCAFAGGGSQAAGP